MLSYFNGIIKLSIYRLTHNRPTKQKSLKIVKLNQGTVEYKNVLIPNRVLSVPLTIAIPCNVHNISHETFLWKN